MILEVEGADITVFLIRETADVITVNDQWQQGQLAEEQFLQTYGRVELVDVLQGKVVERLHGNPIAGFVLVYLLQQFLLQPLIDIACALNLDEQLTGIAIAAHLLEQLKNLDRKSVV